MNMKVASRMFSTWKAICLRAFCIHSPSSVTNALLYPRGWPLWIALSCCDECIVWLHNALIVGGDPLQLDYSQQAPDREGRGGGNTFLPHNLYFFLFPYMHLFIHLLWKQLYVLCCFLFIYLLYLYTFSSTQLFIPFNTFQIPCETQILFFLLKKLLCSKHFCCLTSANVNYLPAYYWDYFDDNNWLCEIKGIGLDSALSHHSLVI